MKDCKFTNLCNDIFIPVFYKLLKGDIEQIRLKADKICAEILENNKKAAFVTSM